MDAAEVLKKPYARLVLPHPDGTYSAEIAEFPGCVAIGATASEALTVLDEVAADWIRVTVSQGQGIPEPMEATEYSGKLVLRMPKTLHKRAAFCAQRDGASLNQFIVTCIAEHIGERAPLNRQIVINPEWEQTLNVIVVGSSNTGGATPTAIWTNNNPRVTQTPWGQNA